MIFFDHTQLKEDSEDKVTGPERATSQVKNWADSTSIGADSVFMRPVDISKVSV